MATTLLAPLAATRGRLFDESYSGTQWNRNDTGGTTMTPHITLSAIADHILELKTLDSSSLKHIEDCVECRSDFQWLKVLRSLGQPQPPQPAEKADVV
jgi:hypothetical protein